MILMDNNMEKYMNRTSYDSIKRNINKEIRNKIDKETFTFGKSIKTINKILRSIAKDDLADAMLKDIEKIVKQKDKSNEWKGKIINL
jgi:uncharacterized membrane-anchored protein YjiN (DUF445 family)